MTAAGGNRAARSGTPTFSIGPLSTVIEAEQLQKFVESAKPGDRKLYATGPMLPRGFATVMLAREYSKAGLVHLLSIRGAHGFDFLAERSSRVPRVARAPVPDSDPDSPMSRLRGIVARAADGARPLHTNATLATLCDLKDANAVKYRLRQILDEGVFRMIDNGPNVARGVVRVAK